MTLMVSGLGFWVEVPLRGFGLRGPLLGSGLGF